MSIRPSAAAHPRPIGLPPAPPRRSSPMRPVSSRRCGGASRPLKGSTRTRRTFRPLCQTAPDGARRRKADRPPSRTVSVLRPCSARPVLTRRVASAILSAPARRKEATMHDSILQSVGWTPLVRLRRLAADVPATVCVKVESLNPGGSVKDRVGMAMVAEAEQRGWLRPGGTIIEATAGNTGVGLAMVAAVKGYRCIFVLPDKMSSEKILLLKAYGAEVVITPTNVPPDSPDSYNGVADRLAREIPGAWRPNQFANLANPEIHYRTTGPEIWEQTEGQITAFVAGVGTGGTISGVGPLSQGAQPERQDHRRRPGGLRAVGRLAEAVEGRGHRRGLRAQDVQQPAGRRMGPRRRRRVVPHGPRTGAARGHPGGRLQRHQRGRRPALRPPADEGRRGGRRDLRHRPQLPEQVLRRRLADGQQPAADASSRPTRSATCCRRAARGRW